MPSSTGPQRMLLAPTPRGRQAFRRWLARPTVHVRDLRSELLIKLLLLERSGHRPDAAPPRPAPAARRRASSPLLRGSARPRGSIAPSPSGASRPPAPPARSSRPCSTSASASRSTTRRSATSARRTRRSTGCPCNPRRTNRRQSRIVLTEPHRGAPPGSRRASPTSGCSRTSTSRSAGRRRSTPSSTTSRAGPSRAAHRTGRTRSRSRSARSSRSRRTVSSVDGLDLLDGTPVLDLKPYVPLFDTPAGRSLPAGSPTGQS